MIEDIPQTIDENLMDKIVQYNSFKQERKRLNFSKRVSSHSDTNPSNEIQLPDHFQYKQKDKVVNSKFIFSGGLRMGELVKIYI